jgi:energy-coupling factor transporter ATP-binding protein EcfA2
MMIQSFSLKNYRSFVDHTSIELRPLTLLFGYNNSGKSGLLRALPLIADSLNGQSTALALDSAAVRGSHFSDLLSRIGGRQEFDLELSLGDAEIHTLKWTFRELPSLRTHIISNFSLLGSDKTILMSAEWNLDSSTTQKLSNKYDVQFGQEAVIKKILKFEGLLPSLLQGQSASPLESIIEQCQQLKNLNIQWLGAVRHMPIRNNPFQGGAPKQLEADGRGAADILAYDQIFEDLLILPKVSAWYEKNVQQKIVIEKMPDHFQIKLQALTNSPYKVNIVDVGEGLIQLLPVLVAATMVRSGGILAIEEPESHLHPRYHAALAEYFFDLARQDNPPQVLLETHSENFLLRTQLEIARGKLDPKSVMVYWVHQFDDGRSVAEPVTFDWQGRPQGEWPRNVFYTDIELSKQLVQERRKHL